MSKCDERPGTTELPVRRDVPRSCGARERNCSPRPREHRGAGARLLLLAGIAGVVAGMVLPQGLLLAAGLVLAGLAGQAAGSPGSRRARPRTR
ncbi:hypothetical protein [Streptomyces sp. Tu 3180]|uniref:hypothetical protein n=1 Tax=Streptomyces sp. Tu 3180 TaxID=2682611 RepID=UPI001358F034|nr:hypothetical protein [Streptomyces sp. Tu 3180]KAF3468962.1 hypothetical protein GL259_34955 [Streptomyces sp. Tu 3180]